MVCVSSLEVSGRSLLCCYVETLMERVGYGRGGVGGWAEFWPHHFPSPPVFANFDWRRKEKGGEEDRGRRSAVSH